MGWYKLSIFAKVCIKELEIYISKFHKFVFLCDNKLDLFWHYFMECVWVNIN